jgi:zinc protease
MTKFISIALGVVLGLAAPARPQPPAVPASTVFPYNVRIETLENGLKIVSVPLDNPNIIAYYTIVRSGSRNEVEPGKSGFAHFFEHMMFKGTKQVPKAAYDELLSRLGAGTNGYTNDDFTCYYVVFGGRENLEKVVRTEADRFINLDYTEDMLKTEAPVIEGEYYASASNPDRRLFETLRDTAYEKHSYKHTTLGFLKDIQDMPNQYEYSLLYKKRFYAPDNTILLVAGDYDHGQLAAFVKKYYGGWQKSNYDLVTPTEPPQTQAKRGAVVWPSPTLARLALGYHGPAFSDAAIDKAALDLLAEIAFAPASPLTQKLVNADQKCLSLSADFADTRDPSLLVITAVVKNDADLPGVEAEILKELERIKTEPAPNVRLADIKSRLRYALARSLETTDGVAGTLAFYLNLTADPGTLNRLFGLYDKVAPRDIQDAARKYFKPSNGTVVTLTSGTAK